MLVKTILNRCEKFKCFVYGAVRFADCDSIACIEVEVKARKGSSAICSGCHQAAPGYDHATEARRFEFIPLWGFAVFLLYVCDVCIALHAASRSSMCPGAMASTN
jgi:hypothetical protein